MNLVNFETDTNFILTLKYFLRSRILIWLSKRLLMLGGNLEKNIYKIKHIDDDSFILSLNSLNVKKHLATKQCNT